LSSRQPRAARIPGCGDVVQFAGWAITVLGSLTVHGRTNNLRHNSTSARHQKPVVIFVAIVAFAQRPERKAGMPASSLQPER
jgi:hypothetical protein